MKLFDFYHASVDRLDGRLPQKYYNEYQYKNYNDRSAPIKVLTTNSNEVRIHTLWQMQVIADAHGINVLSYDDHTNYELYGEMQSSSNMSEEDLDAEYYHPDTFDHYFEHLAGVAAWYGCETMELKCLAKSLFRKYLYLKSADELPMREFQSLYCRLIMAGYQRCAEWLLKNHYNKVKLFTQCGDSSLIVETDTCYVRDVPPTNYNTVDTKLQKYLATKILPRYESYDAGRQTKHILEVANRCVELATNVESMLDEIVNIDMLLTAAYFHDFTLQNEEAWTPQCYAVKVLLEDEFITKFFTPEQIKTIAGAIQQNRCPTWGGHITKLGKMLNAAFNAIDMNKLIRQAYNLSVELNPELSVKGHLGVVYMQLADKYAEGRYKPDNDLKTKSDEWELMELEFNLRDEAEFKNYCERVLTEKKYI